MLDFAPEAILSFFSQYAYEPTMVYSFIVCFMLASSFGLPVPEELILLSAGLVAYMSHNPTKFPPPFPGAEGVDVYTLCFVCFLAVMGSDCLVYFIGKFFGGKIIKTKFFQKSVAGESFNKINSFFQKYGGYACGIFRFTPGLRFPGHLSCGLLGIPIWKFILIDSVVAAISVPTQVYFVATYGEIIIEKIKEFKLMALGVIAAVVLFWLIRKIYLRNVRPTSL